MKYLLCIVALAIPSVSTAGAAGGTIGVYSDPSTLFCTVHDVPGPQSLYVVHLYSVGHVGSCFRIQYSSGFTGTLVGSSSPYSSVSGDPLTGVTVMYDGICEPGSFEILTLNFMLVGGAPDCSWVRTAPHPQSLTGMVEALGCDQVWVAADWEGTHVTPGYGGPECPNDIDYEEHTHFCRPYYEPALAAQHSTWGAVKALYR